MGSIFSTSDKQRAIAKIMKRSVARMNDDKTLREDAERFGKCDVAIVIKGLYGRLGDFHGSYIDGKFAVNIREKKNVEYDAIVTISENAFMEICTGQQTPEYACGTGGIRVDGRKAYQMMVIGIGVGDLLYNVLGD